MNVVKRNGKSEPLKWEKFKKQINFTTMGTDIDPMEFERKIKLFITDGIRSTDLQKVIISTATNNASADEPDWVKVAGRAAMWNLYGGVYKHTNFNVDQWFEHMEFMVKRGYYKPIVTENLKKFNITVEELGLGTLQHVTDNNTDFNKVISSVLSLEEKYLIKDFTGTIIEYPFMMHIANAAIIAEDREMFFDIYETFMKGYISLATPFLRNLRRPDGNTGSCFIGGNPDSLAGILKMLADMSFISKEGGGIGWYIGKIRPGETTTENIIKSNNITKWTKLVSDIAVAVNQKGIRKAGITIGYDWWQLDIDSFLEVKSELSGELRDKAFDIFPQIIVDDYFVDKVINNEETYLFSNYEYNDIRGIDPSDFIDEKLYAIHEDVKVLIEEGTLKHYKKVNARDLWEKMLWTWFEVGEIYITHKDMLNISNVLKNDEEEPLITYCANLCVAHDTKILTKEYGQHSIGNLVDSGIKTVTAWNGLEWSPNTPIFRTDDGSGEVLLTVTLSNGSVLDVTDYHKWYVVKESITEVRTIDLKVGDVLEDYILPLELSMEECKNITVVSISKKDYKEPTYCGTEPKRNKLIFNGVMTGNCIESFSVTKVPTKWKEEVDGSKRTTTETNGIYHSCNLLSINLAETIDATEERITHISKIATYIIDRSVDLGTIPVKEAENGIQMLRNTGIGFIGVGDNMAWNNKMYDTLDGRQYGTKIIEQFSYHIYKASIDLAEKLGSYPAFKASNYKGLFGKTTEELDYISKNFTGNNYDWTALLEDIKRRGKRNFLLLAIAPNTSTGPLMGVLPSYLPAYNKFNYETLMSFNTPVVPKFLKEKRWSYKTRFQYKPEAIVDFTASIQTFIDTGTSMEMNMDMDNIDVEKLSWSIIRNFKQKKLKGVYYSKSTGAVCSDCGN